MKLLDVNVWLAAAWARHAHHPVAKRWIDDDYLAAFALAAEADLVTLERALRTRYPAVRVIVIPGGSTPH